MKLCYTLSLGLALMLFPPKSEANPPLGIFKGYIITLNNIPLTGHLGGMGIQGSQTYVQFINDFGTLYHILPQMVRGFTYETEYGVVVFESWKDQKYWRFLQILHKGKAMSLYFEPPIITGYSAIGQTVVETMPLYYIEVNGKLERITPANFRKKLPRLMQQRAPEMAAKIGSPGYRFRDLHAIVIAYNDYCMSHPFLL